MRAIAVYWLSGDERKGISFGFPICMTNSLEFSPSMPGRLEDMHKWRLRESECRLSEKLVARIRFSISWMHRVRTHTRVRWNVKGGWILTYSRRRKHWKFRHYNFLFACLIFPMLRRLWLPWLRVVCFQLCVYPPSSSATAVFMSTRDSIYPSIFMSSRVDRLFSAVCPCVNE